MKTQLQAFCPKNNWVVLNYVEKIETLVMRIVKKCLKFRYSRDDDRLISHLISLSHFHENVCYTDNYECFNPFFECPLRQGRLFVSKTKIV